MSSACDIYFTFTHSYLLLVIFFNYYKDLANLHALLGLLNFNTKNIFALLKI